MMGTYSKYIGEFELPQTVFKKIVKEVFDNGACQCFNDCACYSRKGLSLGTYEVFTHPLSTNQFHTLKSCEQSYSLMKSKNTNTTILNAPNTH